MTRPRHLLFTLLALLFTQVAWAEEEPLDPDQAFRLEMSAIDGNTVRAHWVIADGYYLYRNKLKFKSDTAGVILGEPRLPKGKVKHDEFFGDVEIYRGTIDVTLPVERPAGTNTIKLTATVQGCADAGICYPPQTQSREIKLAEVKPLVQPLPGFGAPAAIQPFGAAQDELLDADQAFQPNAIALDGKTIQVNWVIAPGYYLYRDKFKIELQDGNGITLGTPALPQGEEKEDEFFGRIQVYHNSVDARLPLVRASGAPTTITLQLNYQGCAEAGVCYPPIKKQISVDLPAADATAATTQSSKAPRSEQDTLAASLKSGNTITTLLLFFGLGLLLAFTPCVFPMIPILSSIIVGHGDTITTRKAFTLSLVYVLAMALTYTVAGIIAGLFGANLQAAFQNPWILGTFSALFVLLALSMFGFYELQLPSALQTKLSEISNKQQGGHLAGVAIMGLLSALIVGPCVAPPLMGALIYIGQTGDAVLGGLALFSLSLGMGAPLVAIGTSAGKLLPRAGGWMDVVKAVFGVLMLAVAIWMLERILPAAVTMVLWGLLLVISAIYMGAIDAVGEAASGWRKLWKGLGLAVLVWGVLIIVGAATGGSDPLQPIRFTTISSANAAITKSEALTFKRVSSEAELNAAVAAASAQGKPVMVDYFADWCVSCKEFEKYTFANPEVQAVLSGAELLQINVTENSDNDQALLKRYSLIGPPAILFFDRKGQERSDFRLVGFIPAGEFASHASKALAE